MNTLIERTRLQLDCVKEIMENNKLPVESFIGLDAWVTYPNDYQSKYHVVITWRDKEGKKRKYHIKNQLTCLRIINEWRSI